MNSMNGFIGKSRTGGGPGQITKGYTAGCGKTASTKDVSPQPKKILNGKVSDKVVQPSAKAKQSR